MNKIHAGVDVSKATLDVAVTSQKEVKSFPNSESELNRLPVT